MKSNYHHLHCHYHLINTLLITTPRGRHFWGTHPATSLRENFLFLSSLLSLSLSVIKWSACQLLKWDNYCEGHEDPWSSSWRKPRTRDPGTEDTSVLYVCIFHLLHLFIILTSKRQRDRLGHLCCACLCQCYLCSCGPGTDLHLGLSLWLLISTLYECVYM